jgi:hypothetical protein
MAVSIFLVLPLRGAVMATSERAATSPVIEAEH